MMIKKNNDVLFCSIILVSKSTISDSSELQIWVLFSKELVRRQKHFCNPCQFAKFFSIRYVLHFNLSNPKNNSEKIRWYIDFPLSNSWTFCNFDTKYCQKIENCSTNSVCFFLPSRNLHACSCMRAKKYLVTEIFPYIIFHNYVLWSTHWCRFFFYYVWIDFLAIKGKREI